MTEWIQMFPAFLLVFARVTSFFMLMPLFSYRTIPAPFKVGLGFFLSLLVFLSMDVPLLEINSTYYFLVLKEVLVGLLIGLIASIMMSAIQTAGGFIDFQMGFAIANVIDPQTGAQSPLIGQYLYIVALFFLLMVNGHHLLLDGIYYSYQFIPLEHIGVNLGHAKTAAFIARSFNTMFMIAMQMALPVVGSLFLVDVAFGILARTFPQLNIFVVGIPIKIAVSLIILFIVMGTMMLIVTKLFETMLLTMRGLMQLFGGL